MSRSTSRPTTVPSTARPSGVSTTALRDETTCALVTNRSSRQAKPAPCPPSTIATTLARSRAAASSRNGPLGTVSAGRARAAARRSPLRSCAVSQRARVDAMNLPARVDQRSAAETGVDREVRLQPAIDLAAFPGAPLAAGRADGTECGARATLVETPQREHEIAGTEHRRIAKVGD